MRRARRVCRHLLLPPVVADTPHALQAANSSTASMEGYTLEGTKKTGSSNKKKAAVLAAVARSEEKKTKK